MNKCTLTLVAAVIACCLCAPVVQAQVTDNRAWSYVSSSIHLDHGDVVIRGNNDTIARITPDGMLFIAGKAQPVTAAQQQQLSRYVATVEDMRSKALALADEAGGFAGRLVSDVLGGLFSGASEARIERDAHQRARDFAQQALPICRDAQALKQIQDTLAAGLSAFKPYAVIADSDVDGCKRDIDSGH